MSMYSYIESVKQTLKVIIIIVIIDIMHQMNISQMKIGLLLKVDINVFNEVHVIVSYNANAVRIKHKQVQIVYI